MCVCVSVCLSVCLDCGECVSGVSVSSVAWCMYSVYVVGAVWCGEDVFPTTLLSTVLWLLAKL